MSNNNYSRPRKGEQQISGIIELRNTKDGDSELLVKRFSRMVRNVGMLDEVRERMYFRGKSERRREAKRERQRVIDRVNRKNNELLNFRGLPKPRKR